MRQDWVITKCNGENPMFFQQFFFCLDSDKKKEKRNIRSYLIFLCGSVPTDPRHNTGLGHRGLETSAIVDHQNALRNLTLLGICIWLFSYHRLSLPTRNSQNTEPGKKCSKAHRTALVERIDSHCCCFFLIGRRLSEASRPTVSEWRLTQQDTPSLHLRHVWAVSRGPLSFISQPREHLFLPQRVQLHLCVVFLLFFNLWRASPS